MEINKELITLLTIIKKLDDNNISKINSFLEKLEKIDENSKLEILKNIISYSLGRIENPEKSDEQLSCEINGHSFTEWEPTFLKKYTNSNEVIKYWRRKCTRCQHVDVSSVEPEKLKNR